MKRQIGTWNVLNMLRWTVRPERCSTTNGPSRSRSRYFPKTNQRSPMFGCATVTNFHTEQKTSPKPRSFVRLMRPLRTIHHVVSEGCTLDEPLRSLVAWLYLCLTLETRPTVNLVDTHKVIPHSMVSYLQRAVNRMQSGPVSAQSNGGTLPPCMDCDILQRETHRHGTLFSM